MRIAFYAPLKPPGHETPSGDRAMARLLIRALETAGHAVAVASTLRGFSPTPDPRRLADLERQAAAEIERLGAGPAPDLWFTYHMHYKAPDLIGPAVAARLSLPYVIAEASHAPKRGRDAWAPWQAAVETALSAADLIFCFTPADRSGLAAFPGTHAALFDLPPFIDAGRFFAVPKFQGGRTELITVAMMRPGVKIDSFEFLAKALQSLAPRDWRLTIVGDGPARSAVEAAFAALPPQKIVWAGSLRPDEIPQALSRADIYLWPGFGEAYGMAYLEAQAAGLPVVALDSGGVSQVVTPGETGFLTPAGNLAAFGAAVATLLDDAATRRRMGRAAYAFAHGERSLEQAAFRIGDGLAAACRRAGRPA